MYFIELNDDLDTCIFFEILNPTFLIIFVRVHLFNKKLCYLYVLVPVRTLWEYISIYLWSTFIYLSFINSEDFGLY